MMIETSEKYNLTINNDNNRTIKGNESYDNVTIKSGNRASYITIPKNATLTVTGTLTIESPTSTNNNRRKYVKVENGGKLIVNNVVFKNTNGDDYDSYLEIQENASVEVKGSITMTENAPKRNYILFSGNGTLNVGGTITGGTITSTSGGGGTPTMGTVNYTGVGTNIGTYNYNNLTISGSGNHKLQGITTIYGNLSLL